ncbi:MAG: alginate export family protein [Verrucomicrobiota bacterium]
MKNLRVYAVGFACISLISISPLFAGTATGGGTPVADLKTPIMNEDLPSSASLPFYTPTWKMGDPMTLANGKVTVDINERIRLEMRNNTFDFNDSTEHVTDDTFVLQRFRLGVKVTPNDLISIYAQGQDSRELFSDRGNVPFQFGAEGDDGFDLYQGYVDIGNKDKFPVTARLGRQVLSYGDERLIGGFDWNNFGRTFDAAKLTYYIDAPTSTSVDYFIGNVVTQEGFDRTDRHNFEFNESNNKDLFTGIYATSKIISFQKTELYALYRGKDRANPEYNATGGVAANNILPANSAYDVDQKVWTFGGRLQSTSPGRLKGFDYTVEGLRDPKHGRSEPFQYPGQGAECICDSRRRGI